MYVEINQRDLKKGSEKDFCNIEGDIWDDFKRDPHFVSLTFADLLLRISIAMLTARQARPSRLSFRAVACFFFRTNLEWLLLHSKTEIIDELSQDPETSEGTGSRKGVQYVANLVNNPL